MLPREQGQARVNVRQKGQRQIELWTHTNYFQSYCTKEIRTVSSFTHIHDVKMLFDRMFMLLREVVTQEPMKSLTF